MRRDESAAAQGSPDGEGLMPGCPAHRPEFSKRKKRADQEEPVEQEAVSEDVQVRPQCGRQRNDHDCRRQESFTEHRYAFPRSEAPVIQTPHASRAFYSFHEAHEHSGEL